MLRSIMGFDWQKSKSHWLLLSKFIRPQSPDNFAKSDDWKNVLGEPPRRAINRFIEEGLVIAANLNAKLSYRFISSELKDMLRQLGLPLSGRKDQMIQRLVVADPDSINKATTDLTILICTQRGCDLADEYIATEKEKRVRVEQQTIEYIKERKFKEASLTVATYEAEQVFPRGMGIDWEHYNPDRDIGMLNTIFDTKPKILAKYRNDLLDDLRLGAAMMALWGKNMAQEWLPPNFETGLSIDRNAAARMFFFYALHQAKLEQYRNSGVVEYVEISVAQDSCGVCKMLANRKYRLDEVPELPYEHCTHKMGCRCVEIPIIAGFSY